MKVTVTKKQGSSPLPITTEFIKLDFSYMVLPVRIKSN